MHIVEVDTRTPACEDCEVSVATHFITIEGLEPYQPSSCSIAWSIALRPANQEIQKEFDQVKYLRYSSTSKAERL